VKTIMQDKRPIYAIYFESRDEGYMVGVRCDRITPYQENGEMAEVTWLAVERDGEVVARVPSRLVSVHYTTKKEVQDD